MSPPSAHPPAISRTNGDKILLELLPLLLSKQGTRSSRCHGTSLGDSSGILWICCQQLVLGEKGGRDVISPQPGGLGEG